MNAAFSSPMSTKAACMPGRTRRTLPLKTCPTIEWSPALSRCNSASAFPSIRATRVSMDELLTTICLDTWTYGSRIRFDWAELTAADPARPRSKGATPKRVSGSSAGETAAHASRAAAIAVTYPMPDRGASWSRGVYAARPPRSEILDFPEAAPVAFFSLADIGEPLFG